MPSVGAFGKDATVAKNRTRATTRNSSMLLVQLVLALAAMSVSAFHGPLPSFQRALGQESFGLRSVVNEGGGDAESALTPPSTSETPSAKLGLLTFDLDDTLFLCQTVVEEADVALMAAMKEAGGERVQKSNIYTTMKSERRKRAAPITYSNLRIRSIRRNLEAHLGKGRVETDTVMGIFLAWLKERQASANRNLFPGTVEMLQKIKEEHPNVCIGAVTNGRGNPLEMDRIKEYFDFCVSGEDDGVFPERKPSPGIYLEALRKYKELHSASISDSNVWCHVGDDLAKDVGASAKLGAYPVWVEIDQCQSDEPKFYSTATSQETGQHKRLAQYAQQEVKEKIYRLSDLPAAVHSLLQQAVRAQLLGDNDTKKNKQRKKTGGRGFQ